MTRTQRFRDTIAAVCPIGDVSIGTWHDRSTWSYSVLPEASQQQIAAAQAVIDSFDTSDAAQTAWEEDQHPERKAIRQAAAQAVQDNQDFLALGPALTLAQASAQLRRLTQQNNAIIRRLIQID